MKQKFGIKLEEALPELNLAVETARNFVFEEFEDEWEKVARFFRGEVSIPDQAGKSSAVKTEVRDILRAVLPSMMRTLLHARKIVEYVPQRHQIGDWTEQQSLYVTQLFWRCGGYTMLMDAFMDALKMSYAPMQTYWLEDPSPKYFSYTHISPDRLAELAESSNVDIQTVSPVTGDELNEEHGIDDYSPDYLVYDVDGYEYFPQGRIVVEAVPPEEFFMSRNVRSVEEAERFGVHGRARNVTVAEALELGLDYDDWKSLDADDVAQSEHVGSTEARRGYYRHNDPEIASKDLLRHEFLLTTVFARYDLKATGKPQLYCFYLGGTSYTYIDHEEVDESPYSVGRTHIVEHEWVGASLASELCKDQDVNSSILRAVIDNFHMSNAPRLAADPLRTDFAGLMNYVAGAPIKTKGDPAIQVVSTPFTGQYGIGILQYLDKDVQERAGVTKAAQGLDPDAMQSTDPEAVKNTIMLSQGQVELMVRNFVETGLIPLFRKMLRLSIRHMDEVQLVRTKGVVLPVPQGVFDPDLAAEPRVGLGTASPETRVQTLGFVFNEQKAALDKYGFDNPFTSLSMLYNTLEDLIEAGGLPDVGRYFKVVTPDVEAELAKKVAQEAQAAQENAPMDPSKAMLQIENVKAQVKQLEMVVQAQQDNLKLQLQALTEAEKLDIERAKLTQEGRENARKFDSDRVAALARIAASSGRGTTEAAPTQAPATSQGAANPVSLGKPGEVRNNGAAPRNPRTRPLF